jgi:hypothetical protein
METKAAQGIGSPCGRFLPLAVMPTFGVTKLRVQASTNVAAMK